MNFTAVTERMQLWGGWRVTLLESMKKQCTFLENAINVTGLSNVKVGRGRSEDLGHNPSFGEQFDGALPEQLQCILDSILNSADHCLPLVCVAGGLFVAVKGHDHDPLKK